MSMGVSHSGPVQHAGHVHGVIRSLVHVPPLRHTAVQPATVVVGVVVVVVVVGVVVVTKFLRILLDQRLLSWHTFGSPQQ